MTNVYLSEVIATRLSHDLIGNIGAVSNAMELLDDTDDGDNSDIYKILNFSADVLTKRLKFFRVCFGLSNATVKSCDELNTFIANYLSTLGNPSLPISLELKIETPKIYKLVMLGSMIMADTLVKGGKIKIIQNDKGIHISAESNAPLNQSKLSSIESILNNNKTDDNPSDFAPLLYLIEFLKESEVPLKLSGNTFIIGE